MRSLSCIFHPPTERDNRLANFDYQRFVLVYAGENGTSRSANKKTQYLNFAPRLGLTYGLTSDARTVLRTGFGITYFPSPYAAGNLSHLNVPFVISQNVQHETNPLDFSRVRTIANPLKSESEVGFAVTVTRQNAGTWKVRPDVKSPAG